MKWQRNYDTKNRTWAGESSFWAASCSRTRPANSRQSHKWDVSGSWWTYFRGGIKLHEHSPCLCKDGNVFQITDGRMEILVARLDFSLLGCRGSSRPTRHFLKKETLFMTRAQKISWECESDEVLLSWGVFLWSSDYYSIKDVYFMSSTGWPSASDPVSSSAWL